MQKKVMGALITCKGCTIEHSAQQFFLNCQFCIDCIVSHCCQFLNVALVTRSLSPAQLLAEPASPGPGAQSLGPEKEKIEQHNNSD